jgi:hypothetical protein
MIGFIHNIAILWNDVRLTEMQPALKTGYLQQEERIFAEIR